MTGRLLGVLHQRLSWNRDQRIINARLERHVLTKGAAVREVEAILGNAGGPKSG